MSTPKVWHRVVAASLAASAMVTTVSSSRAQEETAHVELRSDNPNTTLNRVTGQLSVSGPAGHATGVSFEMVCTIPCNRQLPRNAKYFVGGSGVMESSSFILPPGNVRLDVETGSRGAFIGGVLLSALGGGAMITGGILALAGSGSETSEGLTTPGLVILGAGVPILIVGIVVAAKNTTSVYTAEGMTLARAKDGRPSLALSPGGLRF